MNSESQIRHLLIIEDQNSRRTIPLENQEYSLGRHSNNSIIIYSKQASRKHATLMRKTNSKTNKYSYWILDGDSEGNRSNNGIFVNGNKCSVHELKDGDLINFGCDVNASYHVLSSVTEKGIDKQDNNQYDKPKEAPTLLESSYDFQGFATLADKDYNPEKTVILSEVDDAQNTNKHSDNDNDDTFQDQAYLDNLTDLPNRTLFNEYLSIALANAKRHQHLSAILLLNIQNFKDINETLSYDIGDEVLKAIAKRLNICLRSGDIVARWGGDEFTILLPQLTNEQNVNNIVERILKTVQEPLEINKHFLSIDTYVGVALYPQDGEDPKILLEKVETNLYNNKQQKLNAQHNKEVTINTQLSRLSKVQHRLHQALEKKELFLCYQPQINIKTGEIEAMEAFLRWNHPARGLVAPHQFLPWVDKTDVIVPLTRWILETACSQNKAWQKSGLPLLPVSINLSQGQFKHPQLIEILTHTLSETKLDPQWLEFEITEATVVHDLDLSRKILNNLQQMRICLSIDDFGKGLTSIGYLQELPFHKIKIDQSLIKNLTENPGDNAMISALIALGESFNLTVVAEGVETQQQLEILHSLHCKGMQGYRFSKPLKSDDATKFLHSHNSNSTIRLKVDGKHKA